MTPEQCRMARAAIRWNTTKLALEAGVTQTTINRFENGKDTYTSTGQKIREALENSGLIEFSGDNCVCVKSSE